MAQGYYFARPAPPELLGDFVAAPRTELRIPG
jgi:EAL domain-containing protein (putative c-di-GMP-specific phosphodiesterase class I)